MPQRIALIEDDAWRQFQPLSLLRPVFELCCGHGSVRERLCRHFASSEWGTVVRDHLVDGYREEHPNLFVNDFNWLRQAPTLLVNGRWLCDPELVADFDRDAVGFVDNVPVLLTLRPEDVPELEAAGVGTALRALAESRRPVPMKGTLLQFPWDLIKHNRDWLVADYGHRASPVTRPTVDPRVAVLGDEADIHIHPSADIDPFVVIDARSGPVWVEADVRLQAFTRLEGPCFIGRGSQLFRANVKPGTTIGPVCRVGGEIEECILHGYVNKYHDGFLGHGYICPWVNLGALTTNSDLKNDYSSVSVVLCGEKIESGSNKVGCFIGDHTKTAVGSFLNTGTSLGAMSLILPAGELVPKHVPPFCRIWHGDLESLDSAGLDGGIQTARTAMTRRGVELTPATERLLRRAFDITAEERSAAIAKATARRSARSS